MYRYSHVAMKVTIFSEPVHSVVCWNGWTFDMAARFRSFEHKGHNGLVLLKNRCVRDPPRVYLSTTCLLLRLRSMAMHGQL